MKTRPTKTLAAAWLAAALAGCAPAQHAAPVYEIVPADPPAPVERRVTAPSEIVVREGDTLISLAHLYDLDYKEVARWNNLRDANLIKPGQRLRLTPPPNDPVVIPVRQKPAPALQPAPADSGSVATRPPAPAAPPANTAQTPPSAAPKPAPSTPPAPPAKPAPPPAASPAPATPPAVAPGKTTPFKTEPRAAKYPYSPDTLKKLQAAWQQAAGKNAAAPPPPVAIAPPAASKPATNTGAGKARQRFGISWSRPTKNKQLTKYSSQTKGIDFKGNRGDPVLAAADGVVIYVGTGVKSYGRLVIVRHDNNYLSAYAHNEKILVKENTRVTRGDKIATMGDSGSDRVLLHFEVRKDGKPMDPAQVLPK